MYQYEKLDNGYGEADGEEKEERLTTQVKKERPKKRETLDHHSAGGKEIQAHDNNSKTYCINYIENFVFVCILH